VSHVPPRFELSDLTTTYVTAQAARLVDIPVTYPAFTMSSVRAVFERSLVKVEVIVVLLSAGHETVIANMLDAVYATPPYVNSTVRPVTDPAVLVSTSTFPLDASIASHEPE
jgi:hypothetical protein